MPLNPEEETQFQQWIRSSPWFHEFKQDWGEEPDLNIPNYDLRKAWKAGVVPSRYKFDTAPNPQTGWIPPEGGRYHWASKTPSGEWLKDEKNHPTAWMQTFMEATGKDPNELGLKDEAEGRAYLEIIGKGQAKQHGVMLDTDGGQANYFAGEE